MITENQERTDKYVGARTMEAIINKFEIKIDTGIFLEYMRQTLNGSNRIDVSP
ncbi:hypothetical protein EPICR_20386 [Candidatus Desulfarcum epimagneticum]|uniref:Uncharacterized protein n=1 Tax=uncultured Desulfobacteraceae bacterium TaxID=218296 RepID=A0A484HGV4_9BACT|nr:hypothetical protein EPICR_20386 [uncultured Desulfobacteraceae bacterium]